MPPEALSQKSAALPAQTFIIPALAYNIHYQLKRGAAGNRHASAKPPTNNRFLRRVGGWSFVFWLNWWVGGPPGRVRLRLLRLLAAAHAAGLLNDAAPTL